MGLSIGIVGLPNVGKSTLFNAITNSAVDSQNYPFCTIDPNVGIVPVPDERLGILAGISEAQKTVYATIEFFDIAGLVKGASRGEGLGNKFLANIRETSAIAHVVRCFEDDNIVHVSGMIDPVEDVNTINLELTIADYEFALRCVDNQIKKAKSQNKEEKLKLELFKKIKEHLSENKPVRHLVFNEKEKQILKGYNFLTAKKVIYVANISESMIGKGSSEVEKLREYAESSGDEFIVISTKIESDLSSLEPEEQKEYLAELGIRETGLSKLARACFDLLDLQTFLTTGKKETRAWTIKSGYCAPEAAGEIHTDFEKGFIRANVVSYQDFVECNGWKNAREKGIVRQEGKEYVMQDGDVVEFLFNV